MQHLLSRIIQLLTAQPNTRVKTAISAQLSQSVRRVIPLMVHGALSTVPATACHLYSTVLELILVYCLLIRKCQKFIVCFHNAAIPNYCSVTLPTTTHGTPPSSYASTIGSVASYVCDSGYLGSPFAVCTASNATLGVWSAVNGSCAGKPFAINFHCQIIPLIPNIMSIINKRNIKTLVFSRLIIVKDNYIQKLAKLNILLTSFPHSF